MKLNSFCHLQGEKLPTQTPLVKPLSPGPDLKDLSLSYIPTWLSLPHAPLALESIILRHLDDSTTLLPSLLNSKHLTCIALHLQTVSSTVSLHQWLGESPVYPSLRSFSFAVRAAQSYVPDTPLPTKLLPFLSKHTLLTYLDIDIFVDDDLETFASILRQMKMLEFFGFATRVDRNWRNWSLPKHDTLFGYLQTLFAALPSRLGGLKIGTRYWLSPQREVREPCATGETTHTNGRGLSPIDPSSPLSRSCSAVSIPKLLLCSTNLGQLPNSSRELPR